MTLRAGWREGARPRRLAVVRHTRQRSCLTVPTFYPRRIISTRPCLTSHPASRATGRRSRTECRPASGPYIVAAAIVKGAWLTPMPYPPPLTAYPIDEVSR
jgi:hypothetical protein